MHYNVADMLKGYLDCALWTGIDEQPDGNGGPPLDDLYCSDDFDDSFKIGSRFLCTQFLWKNRRDIRDFMRVTGRDYSDVGHDLWLTRNGHGTGFWDRGAGEVGDRLSAAADKLGELSIYAENGKVYGV